jgi:hypothetical protein
MNWTVHLATNKHSSLRKMNACILENKNPQTFSTSPPPPSQKKYYTLQETKSPSITDSSYRITDNNLTKELINSMDNYPA